MMQPFFPATLLACCLFASIPGFAESSFDEVESLAWGGNTGWISFQDFQPTPSSGVVLGGAFLSGYAWSANMGWIFFGDGSPDNDLAYSNVGNDHGVNHDGTGNLSGFAWSANTGWINFGWAAVSDPDRPRFDLLTGEFSGVAWGANTGWINLGTDLLTAQSISETDTDSDGVADWWEMKHFDKLTSVQLTSDWDKDGVKDIYEYQSDTDPKDPESFFRIISHENDLVESSTTLEFTTSPTRVYCIEYASGLSPTDEWHDSSLGAFSPDQGLTTSRTFSHAGGPASFFRAIVRLPLTP